MSFTTRGVAALPLALPSSSSAASSAFLARFENASVDALPYADALPDGWRAGVDALVRAELRRSDTTADDYLPLLPPAAVLTLKVRAPRTRRGSFESREGTEGCRFARVGISRSPLTLQGCPLVASDLARHVAGTSLGAPDSSRYRLEAPCGCGAADAGALAAALDNARAQLEHQQLRCQNLELLARFGGASWLAHTRSLEAAVAQQRSALAQLTHLTADLHKTRKLQQLAAGAELSSLQAQWSALVAKNALIADACDALEQAQPAQQQQ